MSDTNQTPSIKLPRNLSAFVSGTYTYKLDSSDPVETFARCGLCEEERWGADEQVTDWFFYTHAHDLMRVLDHHVNQHLPLHPSIVQFVSRLLHDTDTGSSALKGDDQ